MVACIYSLLVLAIDDEQMQVNEEHLRAIDSQRQIAVAVAILIMKATAM